MSRVDPGGKMDGSDRLHAVPRCAVAALPRQQQLNRQWSAFMWILLAGMAGTVLTAIGGEPGYARFESADDSFLGIYGDLASLERKCDADLCDDVSIVRCPPRLLNVTEVANGSPAGNQPRIARVQVVVHETSDLEYDQAVQEERSGVEY